MQCLVTGARNVNGYVQLLEKKKKAMKNILVYTNAIATNWNKEHFDILVKKSDQITQLFVLDVVWKHF